MKRFMLWVMAAILICGSMVFSSCSNDDNPTSTKGIVLLAKRGDIDYFRQIEKAFRDACREKGLKAYYYCTTADKAYEDQLAAMEEVKKLGKQVKGIIYTPCYGVNGESAEDVLLQYLNRTYEDLIEVYGHIPAPLRHASLMLVDTSYQHREPASPQNLYAVPYAFDLLVKPYMRLTFPSTDGQNQNQYGCKNL